MDRDSVDAAHLPLPDFLEQGRFLDVGADFEHCLSIVITESDGVNFTAQSARQFLHIGERLPRWIDQMVECAWERPVEREGAVADADVEDGGRRKAATLKHCHRAWPRGQAREIRQS